MNFINEPKVYLLHYTEAPLKRIIYAIRLCRDSFKDSDTNFSNNKSNKIGKIDESLVKKCIDLDHSSVLEFADFTFQIEASRSAQLQLMRHRISSFMSETFRYVTPQKFYIPPDFPKDKEKDFIKICEDQYNFYQKLISQGVPKETAKYALGLNVVNKFLYKTNLRSLRNALSLRFCKKAQIEIRQIFEKIYYLLEKIDPLLVYNFRKCKSCENNCK